VNADVNSASISYEEAKDLARNGDAAVRAILARRHDLRPEILYFLAEDENPEVRCAVAENSSSPGLSNALLAHDADTSVRTELASKIAALAPELDADEADKAERATYEALEILASDQIKVVRAVLSEALKDVKGAPREIIKTLANDLEIDVSGPVLQHSPVLHDEDLLEIIAGSTAEGALNAVARREDLHETVSDAIVATDNHGAIADLLGNNSAQIREETLDLLVDQASGVTLWHKPLVARPQLPEGAAVRMAHYLADNLLAELGQRADMDGATLTEIKTVIGQRIDGRDSVNGGAESSGQDFLEAELPMDMVMRLYHARKLDSKVVEKAMMASDLIFVFSAMLVRAGVSPDVGRRIFREKHPKGILGLSWKAGLPAEFAVQVQKRMGRLSPSEVINASAEGGYPLSDQDLAWQVEFFSDLVAGS
jgi:uncharacterized protein (DUF2336 family)